MASCENLPKMLNSEQESIKALCIKQTKDAVDVFYLRLVDMMQRRKRAGVYAQISREDLEFEHVAYKKELSDILDKK